MGADREQEHREVGEEDEGERPAREEGAQEPVWWLKVQSGFAGSLSEFLSNSDAFTVIILTLLSATCKAVI